ncbi:hypothetical protein Avbf_01961 [Armadillidium vulgare]|nr:hypothetical protein Avbf_01961 [Armadillidium vulgare]
MFRNEVPIFCYKTQYPEQEPENPVPEQEPALMQPQIPHLEQENSDHGSPRSTSKANLTTGEFGSTNGARVLYCWKYKAHDKSVRSRKWNVKLCKWNFWVCN